MNISMKLPSGEYHETSVIQVNIDSGDWQHQVINSSPPSAAYMRQWTRSALAQIMARRQAIIWTIAGLLSIGPLGTNFSEILIKIQNFHSRKCIWKYRLRNGGHFVQGEMS